MVDTVSGTSQAERHRGMGRPRALWGGTFLGFILGVVVGLAAALGVAIYVTKVPVPFVNKGQSRTADQDAAEAKKNKDWDPNAPLYGKNPAKAASAPSTDSAAPAVAADPTRATDAPKSEPARSEPSKPEPSKPEPAKTDSAKADAAKPPASRAEDAKKTEGSKPPAASSSDPIADIARAKGVEVEPFVYYVQLGAFRTQEDAEALRAKLSLSGIETRISEREQSGRTVYRVRVGPFDRKEDGERSKEKLDKAGMETALVRVQR